MTRHLYPLLIAAIGIFSVNEASAQKIDSIKAGDKNLITSQLKPGLKQYMVYFQMPARKKSVNISLWLRKVQKTTRNNEAVFITTQHWYASDTNQYRHIISVNKATDFSPLYHRETIGTKTKAYNWGDKKISGADTVTNNLAKDFTLAFDQPNLNWNLDVETFEMLPLAYGKVFAINFYDAGIGKPAYTTYKVTGSEMLTLLNNEKVDCWKLVNEGDFNGNKFTQTFWISKKSHEFLKEEDAFNGGYRYKVKLPGNAPDLLARFK
ncbi:hypothetical protein LJ707_17240 [Mucilaginibacter sp. UR6-1]|uniref:DUF3108 domain-containing protein n=1 Tax=Mucilaginibacter sp. UR6-1 TaxID=1435643 RepID=UPI001E3DC164|nr:hypothetical protein [Mucilaginibacter sp. UR6-1]MCC8410690.1 hypothetical protein [Mucilaginibacter sp. UR6-1]